MQTVDGAKNAVTAVIKSIDDPSSTSTPKAKYNVPADADPLAWAQSQSPAIFGPETSGTSSSNERQLATGLVSLAESDGTELTLSDVTGSTGNYSRTATVPAGLYVIVDTSATNPSVPMIVATAPWKNADGTINMKNAATSHITKQIDNTQSASAFIGEKKTITLTTTMPQTANRTSYTWRVFDLADPGMTIDTSTIQIAGKSASDGSTVNFTVQTASRSGDTVDLSSAAAATGDFTGTASQALVITLDKPQLDALGVAAGNTVTITYTARLNDSALNNGADGAALADGASSVIHAAKNRAIVSDNGLNSRADDPKSTVLLNTADFVFSKVWADNTHATGAKFTVSKVSDTHTDYLQAYDPANGWAWRSTAHEFAANQGDNKYLFRGLADGTYTITESTVATGALPAMKPSFTVTIDHTKTTPVTATSSDAWGLVNTTAANGDVATVTNVHNITELPKTGAAGIILLVAVIVLLFGGAFLLISVYRRKASSVR